MTRPETKIPEKLEKPFPLIESGQIKAGFGRGSSELGIPTANVPVSDSINDLETGIYFGWCKLAASFKGGEVPHARADGQIIEFNGGKSLTKEEQEVLPMVMSIGWNPFYSNEKKAAEIHIIHKFKEDFYGADLKYVILGYIRPELDYTTKEALIADIQLDIEIAKSAFGKEAYRDAAKLI